MIFVGVFLYLLLVSTVAAWLLLPGVRRWLGRRTVAVASTGRGALRSGGGQLRRRTRATRRSLAVAAQALGDWRGPVRWWLAAALLLGAVPALTLWLRQWHAYDGFDHTASRAANPQVAALLAGEQLVPPAPLPPELFTTPELERERPAIATASRHWELLDGEFRNRLLAVYRIMREQHGYEMVLLEGYRSPERQAQLAALGPQVTQAGPGHSYHQYGLAADSAFLIDGRIVINERDPVAAHGYEILGAVAQSAGLVWGGSWRSLKDLGHVELRRPGVMRSLPAAPPGPSNPPSSPSFPGAS
ncbi:M15 family metallopeptidase [Pseudorhodoferax sp.]|uniref:M15 family metallopeptidase n=1 Tax=Pseudorhodoferax sp. TaxID=1993553 RepID=UPI0039E298A8